MTGALTAAAAKPVLDLGLMVCTYSESFELVILLATNGKSESNVKIVEPDEEMPYKVVDAKLETSFADLDEAVQHFNELAAK